MLLFLLSSPLGKDKKNAIISSSFSLLSGSDFCWFSPKQPFLHCPLRLAQPKTLFVMALSAPARPRGLVSCRWAVGWWVPPHLQGKEHHEHHLQVDLPYPSLCPSPPPLQKGPGGESALLSAQNMVCKWLAVGNRGLQPALVNETF